MSIKADWIDNPSKLEKMVDVLKTQAIFGLDTEFIRETTFFPKIALIQVATKTQSWLVDPLAFTAEELKPFTALLTDKAILKIIHAAHGDQECFFHAYGVVAAPVLDTSVAAALCGYGENIGLAKLLKETLDVHLPKGRARVKWLQRPLSQDLLEYAEQDVAHLVEMSEFLKKELESWKRWDWALEESHTSVEDFEETPTQVTKRLSKNGFWDAPSFAALEGLVHWREDRARNLNIPRGWVADNETLMALARVRPKSTEELKSFRGLKPKVIERSGDLILELFAKASLIPIVKNENVRKDNAPREYDEHALELIKAFLAYLSSQHHIAMRFLIPPAKYGVLLEQAEQSVESWVQRGLLSSFAAESVGEEIRGFLNGFKGLALKKGRVECIQVKA